MMNNVLRSVCVIYILSFVVFTINAQKASYVWLGGRNSWIGMHTNRIVFSDSGITSIDTVLHPGVILRANSSYCDPETGELLLYTDGFHLFNGDFELVPNGDSLSPVEEAMDEYQFENEVGYFVGSHLENSIVILPIENDRLGIIHQYGVRGIVDSLFYSLVKIKNKQEQEKSGSPEIKVLKKNIVCSGGIEDYSANCIAMSAIRHANGRDWWAIIGGYSDYPAENSTRRKYYLFLIDTTGMHFYHKITFQGGISPFSKNVDMLMANKDGTKLAAIYANRDISYSHDSIIVQLYSFNRCKGDMSALGNVAIDIPNRLYDGRVISYWTYNGLTFSPNGEFLYVNFNTFIIQYPILEEDWQLKGDTIARWSKAIDEADGVPRFSLFGNSRMAPDGKIYISAAHDLSKYMHVIHFPNRKGDACKFEQNGLSLPLVNKASIPFYVNYNLGPIDGGPCDTLGLNNHVLAQFRYDILDEKKGKVYFTDLSDFSPTSWHWDFDDGMTSEEQYPLHIYKEEGIYHVCLTASNMNGSDTYCRDVVIDDLTSTQSITELQMNIYPNPIQDDILHLKTEITQSGEIMIYNIRGEKVYTDGFTGTNQLNIQLNKHLNPGVYIIVIRTEQGVWSGKFIQL